MLDAPGRGATGVPVFPGMTRARHTTRARETMTLQLPTILQVLPSLVTGGVERGTIEITDAIANAGWTALVASSGGPLVAAVERVGGRHITLPLDARNPIALLRNAGRLARLIRGHDVDIVHARLEPPPGRHGSPRDAPVPISSPRIMGLTTRTCRSSATTMR